MEAYIRTMRMRPAPAADPAYNKSALAGNRYILGSMLASAISANQFDNTNIQHVVGDGMISGGAFSSGASTETPTNRPHEGWSPGFGPNAAAPAPPPPLQTEEGSMRDVKRPIEYGDAEEQRLANLVQLMDERPNRRARNDAPAPAQAAINAALPNPAPPVENPPRPPPRSASSFRGPTLKQIKREREETGTRYGKSPKDAHSRRA